MQQHSCQRFRSLAEPGLKTEGIIRAAAGEGCELMNKLQEAQQPATCLTPEVCRLPLCLSCVFLRSLRDTVRGNLREDLLPEVRKSLCKFRSQLCSMEIFKAPKWLMEGESIQSDT